MFFFLNIAIIGIVVGIEISKEGLGSLSAIGTVEWRFLAYALLAVVIGLFLDQIRYCFLIYKATKVFRPFLSYKVTALGRHYDIITPLGSGGQPFQMFYLNKYGVKPGASISIIMGKYIFYQIANFIFITIILFSNLSVMNDTTVGIGGAVFTTMSWIGYVVISVVIFTITIVSLNKRIGAGIVIGILKLLHKMKIVKNYNASFKKVMKTVNTWQNTMRIYKKSWLTWFFCLSVSFIYMLVNYTMPYLVYCAFLGDWAGTDVWVQIITMSVMVDLASVYNPLPVGAGTSEGSFTAYFQLLFFTAGIGSSKLWALLIWKFLYFYIYMVQGLFVICYDYAIGNRKLEKNKEKWLVPLSERVKQRLQKK